MKVRFLKPADAVFVKARPALKIREVSMVLSLPPLNPTTQE